MRVAIYGSVIAVAAVGVATALSAGSAGGDDPDSPAVSPGQPNVEILTPRNGSRHENRSAIVRVDVENFHLAPEHFGRQPQLAEGHLRFSLNRVPDCVTPEEAEEAVNDPGGSGRVTGKSFDFPQYSGPNGRLAEQIGSTGSYSPSTVPKILYANLHPGFYRLVVALARNNGTTLPAHDVTTFQILPAGAKEGEEWVAECPPGEVPTGEALDLPS